jgi:hypothetical protein
MEIDLSQLKGKAPESHLLLLDQYCERLAKGRKPAFLLFDEFQELARSKAAAPLIAALRTSLDKRKDGLVAVFTGSSREGLRAMFSPREAPFFRFATPIDLRRIVEINRPSQRVRYELQEIGQPTLVDILAAKFGRKS